VLRIPETRQEIREEIHDVLGIVEGGYLEEQRRQLQEVLSHSP
jgi:predicted RNase H-like HicB family nuclease